MASLMERVLMHVVFPARLSDRQDSPGSLENVQNALVDSALKACIRLKDATQYGPEYDSLRRSLQSCKNGHLGGTITKASLVNSLREIEPESNDTLILYVAEQNAALLIRHQRYDNAKSILIEGFEASALSEAVLAAEGPLEWDFPGCAVSIPTSTFANPNFQEELATFLSQASKESIKQFAAKTNKAGAFISEIRDTTDPSLITSMLMTILEANGARAFPPILRKRVRDDVCWDGAAKPWRRSPFWLALRVGMQRHLSTPKSGEVGRILYKFLMCQILSDLLEESSRTPNLNIELVSHLNTKLCRRLAKLEIDKERALPKFQAIYDHMLSILGPFFDKITTNAVGYLENLWAQFKTANRRPVPTLPRRSDPRHLHLTLPNSGPYIQQVLNHQATASNVQPSFNVSCAVNKDGHALRYWLLYKMETDIEQQCQEPMPASDTGCEERCIALAHKIEEYMSAVGNAYDNNPEQKSVMLLTVMELWVSMEQCALRLYGLLRHYDPIFPKSVLDVLQLSRPEDMRRLQNIRSYLHGRLTTCGRLTIFSDPVQGCFGERYFDESKDSLKLNEIHRKIESQAQKARENKEQEWRTKCLEYEALLKNIAEKSHVYEEDQFRNKIHLQHCTKCYLERQARRFRINIQEHPLPSDYVQAKVVVFELACPSAFASYRDATWRILSILSVRSQVEHSTPTQLLTEYSELKNFVRESRSVLTLASKKKSFLQTHYSNPRFPVDLEDVCLPNGLKYEYFDTRLEVWTSCRLQRPTFAHHCQLLIPPTSPFSIFLFSPEFNIDTGGPSSYSTVASQTRCPSGVNVHEFMAYQALFSGTTRRWPQILLELGASNLNFSTETTALLLFHLALQVGPCDDQLNSSFGSVHKIFKDASFCAKLLGQLSRRLDNIASNWRETNCMESMITLIQRLVSLGTGIGEESLELLGKVRNITFQWIIRLRDEVQAATDAEMSRVLSRYALWAAVLCRRTFVPYLENTRQLEPEALQYYIESSITMQDNMVSDIVNLPILLRFSVVRDLKMVYRMRHILRQSLQASPQSLISSVKVIWPDFEAAHPKILSGFRFLEGSDRWWVQVTIEQTALTRQQTVHFHLLKGHLLVDGKPIGRLPASYLTNFILKELFGNQNLLAYPSNLPGMSYALAVLHYGHQIHLGFRNNHIVVRSLYQNAVMEFIPRQTFLSSQDFDLPASLVDNCVHWLHLSTGRMEIRQRPHIWKSKDSNWTLDFHNRRAFRRTVTLVDPNSLLFKRIGGLFGWFESPRYLTVFQPLKYPLSVELRRLELAFFVNRRGYLESAQLRAEIDPDQDAGTWYGLASKIVLREITPGHDCIRRRQRSIIVPLGKLQYKRHGHHITAWAENNGDYGRYAINKVLGRLDCPAEPRLLYFKALCHAYTSFILPDLLTGRTGTEEALHCLNSGCYQPWTPLHEGHSQLLRDLASLTPRRVYYPHDMKVMQKVQWNPALTTTIQHDGFRAAVEAIFAKSNQLLAFAPQQSENCSLEPGGDLHLTNRSHSRREAYQRSNTGQDFGQVAKCATYATRDHWRAGEERSNVLECASLLLNWPSKMSTTNDLAGILQTWHRIGGYNGILDKVLLSDTLGLNFAPERGSLVNRCLRSTADDMYQLIFLFSAISFRQNVDMNIMRTLIAFAVFNDLKALAPPDWPVYDEFRHNQLPTTGYLQQLMKPSLVPYESNELSAQDFNLSAKQRKKNEQREQAHEHQQEVDSKILADFLLQQWPCPEPTLEGVSTLILVDIAQALEVIRPEWLRLFQNFELSQYISQVQSVLDKQHGDKIDLSSAEAREQEILPSRIRGGEFPTLSELLGKMGPNLLLTGPSNLRATQISKENITLPSHHSIVDNRSGTLPPAPKAPPEGLKVGQQSSQSRELKNIIACVTNSASAIRRQYGKDLMQSLNAWDSLKFPSKKQNLLNLVSLANDINAAETIVKQHFDRLSASFVLGDNRARWLRKGGLWPVITPVALLENLRSSIPSATFGTNMKEYLVQYALSITKVQQLMRMEGAVQKGNRQRLVEEQENLPHSNWEPMEFSDWLLLEIDSDILIRPGQVDVARATISPASGANSVLQMNMGQGKTSCIIPMAAAVLADGIHLLRVIIPKALLLQTAQLLHARLGGLLGREIRHIPFSRKTSTSPGTLKSYYQIHNNIRKASGIMLSLPEHLLSFKLSGLQRLSDGVIEQARTMLNIQDWLSRKCRDILDEADYILAIRTQLIYPSGSQKTVDGHPHRWETIEALLKMVEAHLWNLEKGFPQSIEVVRKEQGRFPVVFFLRQDVEDALISRLVDEISRGRTSLLPEDCKKSDRQAIKLYISEARVSPEIVQHISKLYPEKPAVKQVINLLRGLLVHRILLMTLKKRWNVQYGLHPTRDPIAVPYHAKGTPSEQAEWGHPDVAILFTCLSFYHGGLTVAQLGQTLEHVLKSDDPSQVYDTFSESSNLPDSLRDWSAINLDDETQIFEIWTHVRYQVVVVDYFLNNFVFPRHAKQFQLKLQASGWDLPLFSPQILSGTIVEPRNTASKPALTTGFSGTNDWKRMLPLTIKQQDLKGLSHTNAEVLTYLLQDRSRQYVLAADPRGRRLSEEDLLRRITNMHIRVLIDAGAQILEMDNVTLAKAWLEIATQAPAVVYFKDNKPFVRYRQGREVPLLASPFADDLGECLVYLDEAHTRGTDLKMPAMASGALTLGLGQTKDHTVQAAMRLRQLGTTQSVAFFAPPEVHQSILDVRNKYKTINGPITSYDVVHWLLEQTCAGIEQLQPLYFSQGADFCRRAQAALDHPDFLLDEEHRQKYLLPLRQYEQQSLQELYGVGTKVKQKFKAAGSTCQEINAFTKELDKQRKAFQDTGSAVHGSALQEVEQEREVAYEVENVREVQKPVHYLPYGFSGLHSDITSFAKTGRFAAGSAAYEHAFGLVRRTHLGRKHRVNIDGTTQKLYVSTEFTRTVKFPSDRSFDNFQRHPNWILWSSTTEAALIVIPEEAELLIPLLQQAAGDSPTYLLTYSAPVTRKMLHFDNLNFYAIPSLPIGWEAPTWLKVELGLFAGRLYFDFSEYELLCQYLGVKESSACLEEDEEDLDSSPLAIDGVVEEEATGKELKVFARKPLTFMHEWLALRRKGQDFASTPMGHVCQGKVLKSDHPFFKKPDNRETDTRKIRRLGVSKGMEDEDEEDEDEFYDIDEDAYGDVGVDEVDTFDDAALEEEESPDSESD